MPPSSAWEQVAKDLLVHLQTARDDLDQLTRSINTELTENKSARGVLQEKVEQLSEYISDLDRVLRGGSGQEALTSRITKLETTQAIIKQTLDRIKPASQPFWEQVFLQCSPVLFGLLVTGIGWLIYLAVKDGWKPGAP